jgi:hypothetical protein
MSVLDFIIAFGETLSNTIKDIASIVLLIAFFYILILKKSIPNLPKVFVGFIFVILGLTFFLIGLELALFPIGTMMSEQLSSKTFLGIEEGQSAAWTAYYWTYIFAASIGFATTLAEPSLKAVAIKANEVSGGTMSEWGLRIAVAVGAGIALALGAFRIVVGTPLYVYLIICYLIVIIQTIFSNKNMVALAYDSGGVTTSTVTVPIVAAIGIGLSTQVDGRNPAIDGFGMIALVCMFPIISVLAYVKIMELITKYKKVELKN